MLSRSSLFVAVPSLLVGFVIGAASLRPASAQRPAPAALRAPGRYYAMIGTNPSTSGRHRHVDRAMLVSIHEPGARSEPVAKPRRPGHCEVTAASKDRGAVHGDGLITSASPASPSPADTPSPGASAPYRSRPSARQSELARQLLDGDGNPPLLEQGRQHPPHPRRRGRPDRQPDLRLRHGAASRPRRLDHADGRESFGGRGGGRGMGFVGLNSLDQIQTKRALRSSRIVGSPATLCPTREHVSRCDDAIFCR